MSKLIASVVLLLATAISASVRAQSPVLDTEGNPVRSGIEYYVLPAVTDVAGGLTLVRRNGSNCPPYVGQAPLANVVSRGYPVTFRPFTTSETIYEGRDIIVQFEVVTTCILSTAWGVGEMDSETNRRLIVTGEGESYFRIDKKGGLYNLGFCPTESCPNCRVACGSAGILEQNGTRFLALDDNAFPFEFTKA